MLMLAILNVFDIEDTVSDFSQKIANFRRSNFRAALHLVRDADLTAKQIYHTHHPGRHSVT